MQAFFESWYGQLITAAAAILLILAGIGVSRSRSGEGSHKGTRMLVFSAVMVAVATVLSFVKILKMPQGGSVTLFSMLPITLIGYIYGPAQGILCGMAYGLIQLILGPWVISPVQLLVDYPLAFGALGLSGFFWKRQDGMLTGYAVGCLGRLIMSVISGVVFFSEYAAEWNMNPLAYSFAYNIAYIGAEALVTIVVFMAVTPVKQSLERIKTMARA
ncbi:MAG: energy-coupled thiamine transporter ThiT [Firmicutes bacterium]|nr:energy-coupled thiamine transporter ThiT [Bacillota bacterium]